MCVQPADDFVVTVGQAYLSCWPSEQTVGQIVGQMNAILFPSLEVNHWSNERLTLPVLKLTTGHMNVLLCLSLEVNHWSNERLTNYVS